MVGYHEQSQGLLSDEEVVTSSKQGRQPRPCSGQSLCLHWLVHITTLVLVLGLYSQQSLSKASINTFELYSPARDSLGDDRKIQKFQASFWQTTPYKGPPTPEIIANWHHLTHTPALNLTREEVLGMGISTDSVQYPDKYGGGYLAYLESAHLLHCLETLWEDHHYHKYPELFPVKTEKLRELPEIEEHHFEHCVDVLRQQLMCNANSGVVTFRWVKGISGPYPDFSSKHVCRDYESLLSWGKTRQPSHEGLYGHDWTPYPGVVKMAHAP